MAPSSIGRGQPSTFMATASDPDDDPLKLTWFSAPGRCTPGVLPAGPATTGASYTITPPIDGSGTICVAVVATDAYGATSTRWTTVPIANRPPVARIDVQQLVADAFGHYDLYSTFRLSAAGSTDTDGDPLTYLWNLDTAPVQNRSALADCLPATTPSNLVKCLGPVTEPGAYTVELVANDGTNDSAPVTVTLIVNSDREPCLTSVSPADPTAPIDWDPTADKTFEVQDVSDDGSPYPSASPPNGAPTFTWSLRRAGDTAWEPIAGFGMLAAVTVPGDRFTIGDSVDVRVEVRDQATHAIDGLDACGDIAICPTDCPERVTWRINYR